MLVLVQIMALELLFELSRRRNVAGSPVMRCQITYQSNRAIEIDLDFRMIELSKCQYFTNQIELSGCQYFTNQIELSR